jgi:hypothetical protein
MSLVGTEIRESACGFSRTESPDEVLAVVTRVRDALVRGVESHLRNQPAPPIATLIRLLGKGRSV